MQLDGSRSSDKPPVALVLSGGASRGALQVGALRALLEAGVQPDMLVGVSAGALNAAYLAVYGWSREAVNGLEACWQRARKEEVYPGDRLAMVWRALRGEASLFPADRFRAFLETVLPANRRRFGELSGPRLFVVATCLEDGTPYLFGQQPDDPLLEALLASSALPPLHPPLHFRGHWLADGGISSPLPVGTALELGVKTVWALHVRMARDPARKPGDLFRVAALALSHTLDARVEIETRKLQSRHGRYIQLQGFEDLAPWEFHRTEQMIQAGYRQAIQQLQAAADQEGARGRVLGRFLRRQTTRRPILRLEGPWT